MAYCGPRGIELDAFLQWSPYSQDAALAWQAHESRRCRSCGTHPDDWRESIGGSRHAWHAEDFTCLGCVQLQQRAETNEVKSGGRGIHIRLSGGSAADCERCKPK